MKRDEFVGVLDDEIALLHVLAYVAGVLAVGNDLVRKTFNELADLALAEHKALRDRLSRAATP